MSVNQDQIRQVAHLARIAISEAELAPVQEKLNHILEMIEQVQAVDTDGIEPMHHPLAAQQRLRPDEVTEQPKPEVFVALAPDQVANLFLVPRADNL